MHPPPNKTPLTQVVSTLPLEEVEALDAWAAEVATSRAGAIRALIRHGVGDQGLIKSLQGRLIS
jgi:hypothetical protein